MADKPCRWVDPIVTSCDGLKTLGRCSHPMVLKFLGKGGGHVVIEESCHGCPCHEPQPDPTPTGGKTGHDQP